MEVEGNVTSETPEVTETQENVTNESSEGGTVEKAPEYVPNYKFKVHEEEKEFDEFLRGAIKDKESEEKVRKMYAKSEGFDHYVKNQTNWKEKVEKHYQPLEQKHQQLEQNLNQLGNYVSKKDYQSFFDTLKIPKQDILKYALDIVNFEELPPEQKAAIEAQKQTEQVNARLMEQTSYSQQQAQEYAVQIRTMQLNNELMKSDVSSLVQNFDAKANKPGAFRDLVINHANMAYYRNNTDMSVEQAVKEVMSLYGNLVAQPTPPTQSQNSQAQQRPPIIPNVQGSGNSPAKKSFKSLDEIRAHAKTLNN